MTPGSPGAVGAAGPAPLSVDQEPLWDQSLLRPQEIAYNEVVCLRHPGSIDVDALSRALEALIERHEIWRTTFDLRDSRPVQLVGAVPVIRLAVLDLSGFGPDAAQAEVATAIGEVARVPYDLRRGPLLRPRLVRMPDGHHRLYLAMHHIIFDGVSISRTVPGELSALYAAFVAGRPSPLPPPAVQYGDYARWEQQRIGEPRQRRRIEWWRTRLDGVPLLQLPTDRPRREVARRAGAAVACDLPEPLVGGLQELAAGAGATLFQALGAAWALLLSRWSGQDDVAFGTPADLRQRSELEAVVGYCVTPLVVRVDLTGAPDFIELLTRVRNATLDGLDQLVPFERVVRELDEGHPDGATPVYQTILVLEPSAERSETQWSLHLIDAALGDATGATRMDLELQLDQQPAGHLAGRLIYDAGLFDRSTIVRLIAQLRAVIAAAIADPRRPVRQLSLMGEVDAPVFTATATGDRAAASIAELIAAQAQRGREAIALTAGGETIDRAELARRVARDPPAADAALALALGAELGLSERATVIIVPETPATPATPTASAPPALPAAVWPALCAGAHVVLPELDPEQPGAGLTRLVRATRASLVLASPSTWRTLIDTGMRPGRSLCALVTPAPADAQLAAAILERCRIVFCAHTAPGLPGPVTFGQLEPAGPLTIGWPLPDCRVAVLDATGEPTAVGEVGELVLARHDAEVRTAQRARRRGDGRVQLVPR